MNILINEDKLFSSDAIKTLQKIGKIYINKLPKNKTEIEIIFVKLRDRIDSKFLNNYINLKYIVCPTTSITHIDQEICKAKKIKIIKLNKYDFKLNAITSTAELTINLILNLKRKTHKSYFDLKSGKKLSRYDYIGDSLNNLTIGIIGMGRIGSMVAKMSNAFNMKIIAFDKYKKLKLPRYIKQVDDINYLFEFSDIISLHISEMEENYDFITSSLLMKCKKKPLFINTSRGEFVDEKALLKALNNGLLSGIGLDVTKNEYSKNRLNKTYNAHLKKNMIITPHIGGCTLNEMKLTEEIVCKKLLSIIKQNEI
tara:strand:- start:75 stop:1010 length:936 start_codon:yes stop_codon:yes gene_type:complete